MKRHAVFFILCIPAFLLPELTSASVATPSCRFAANLTLGSRGESVACLQRTLLASGYSIPAGATGYFGPQTRTAVSAWQKNKGVSPAYGYFGPLSRRTFAARPVAATLPIASVAASPPVAAAQAPAPVPTLPALPPATISGIVASVAAVQAQPSVAPVAPVLQSTAAPAPAPAPAPALATPIPVSIPEPEPAPMVPAPAPAAEIVVPVPAPSPAPSNVSSVLSGTVVPSGEVKWSCDFENDYCGFYEQSKVEPDGRRSSFVPAARSGRSAVKLTTLSGDTQVHGSGDWERNDLSLAPSAAYCNEGQEEWWALSVLFPEDYVVPSNSAVMDFHHNASGGQANFHITSTSRGLEVRGFYGDVANPQEYRTKLGAVERGVWYDFVYHVKWSSAADGFMTVWMNGKKMLSHSGPTLYPGISCYLKLANYHEPFGASNSVIFDRVLRGTSAGVVSDGALEGE